MQMQMQASMVTVAIYSARESSLGIRTVWYRDMQSASMSADVSKVTSRRDQKC